MNRIIKKQWLVLMAIVFSLLILAGCQFLERYLDAKPVGDVDSGTEELGLFSDIDGITCIPDIRNFEEATLAYVIDGDSIAVNLDGNEYQVRYVGIDTPEFNSDQRPAAIEATSANRDLIRGEKLYLFKDQTNTDKYDRLLRFVVANGKFINYELVKSGHARSNWYSPDISCNPTFDLVSAGIK